LAVIQLLPDIYVEEGFESGSIAGYKASIEGSGVSTVSGGASR